jgi:hypothetical protein
MTEYHKINAPFMRDKTTHRLVEGAWCDPALEYLADNRWEFTEKVDGTNMRVNFSLGTPGHEDFARVKIDGKTDNAQIPPKLLAEMNRLFGGEGQEVEVWPGMQERFARSDSILSAMLDRKISSLTVYGEGYGGKIQGGGKYSLEPKFVVFDIKVGDFWLARDDVFNFCETHGLDAVPVVGYGTLSDAIKIVSNNMRSQWGDFEAEGIVARPATPLFDRAGRRIITKIKGVDFR